MAAVRERDRRVVDAFADAHAVAQHGGRLEQHLALLLGDAAHRRGLSQLAQPVQHVLRLVDDFGEGLDLLGCEQRAQPPRIALLRGLRAAPPGRTCTRQGCRAREGAYWGRAGLPAYPPRR